MCVFTDNNKKKIVAMALVPFVAINVYVGSKLINKNNINTDKQVPEATQLVEVDEIEEPIIKGASTELIEVNNEKNEFTILKDMYLSQDKSYEELLQTETDNALYVSALYAKAKAFNISDEDIRRELNNIITMGITFTDTTEEEWNMLFGNLNATITCYDNVMDYYYPLALYTHYYSCDLEHTHLEFAPERVSCDAIYEQLEEMLGLDEYYDFILNNVLNSRNEKLICDLERILSSDVNYKRCIDELENVYQCGSFAMQFDEELLNDLVGNLKNTCDEDVFEYYLDLANYVHNLTNEYYNMCEIEEGKKLTYSL